MDKNKIKNTLFYNDFFQIAHLRNFGRSLGLRALEKLPNFQMGYLEEEEEEEEIV